ncbi:hypothetical protein P9X10_01355 [Bacillus cereus]|nr:hypothetical protein [Bacillus cereus]
MLELKVIKGKDQREGRIEQIQVIHEDKLVFLCSSLPTIKLLLSDLDVPYPNESKVEVTDKYAISTMKINTTRELVVEPYSRDENLGVNVDLVASVVGDWVIKVFAGTKDNISYLYYPKVVIEDHKGIEYITSTISLDELSLI